MKHFTKLTALLLVLMLAWCMAACSAPKQEAAAPEEKPAETETNAEPAAEPAAEAPAEEPAPEPAEEPVELIVFAAASMTETLQQLEPVYKEIAPNVSLVFNFDSSGTLKTQIQEGADCDVFISAGQKQVNQIDGSKDADGGNTEGLDLVLQGSRIDLLENKVVLCVPESNPKGINSFDDWAELMKNGDILFAMGNSDVPVGQYTQQIIAFYGLNEEELAKAGKITYGTNVKEVTTQVKEGSVDAGVVYCTDAFSAGLTVVDQATKDMCKRIVYPACIINTSKHADAAQKYLEFLQSDAAMEVFSAVGFVAP